MQNVAAGKRRELGQSLLETALILPILLLLLLGIIEFGKLFIQYFGLVYTADHISQAAARLGGYTSELDTVRNNNRLPFIDNASLTVTVNTVDSGGAAICSTGHCLCQYGEAVIVGVTHPAQIRIMGLVRYDLTLRVQQSLFCWRGGAP
jgi:Flp pilus assembly protein TadG